MPRISVVIPVYNDADGLRHTLQSLVNQSYTRGEYEIIVVDNGSIDGTPSVAGRFTRKYPNIVRCAVEDAVQSSYAARNRGIMAARGDVICFIDSDMTAPHDYLRRIDACFADSNVHYVGCHVAMVLSERTLAAKYNASTGFPVQRYLEVSKFAPTCCLSVRRSVFSEVGMFDSRLESGGDYEFGQRVHASGFNQRYAGDILLLHPSRAGFPALLKKSRRVARGIAQIEIFHSDRHASLGRRFFSPLYYRPPRPRNLRKIFARAHLPIRYHEACVVSLLVVALKVVRPYEFLVEKRRARDSSLGERNARFPT